MASVGEEAYISAPKGALVPHHALVIPIAHRASSLELTPPERAEMTKYIAALRACFEARGEAIVSFERYMANSQFEHLHIQVLPLPHNLASGAAAAFRSHGARLGIHFEEVPPGRELTELMPTPEPFFCVELADGVKLLHRMASNPRKHPLHFGREVVAALIGSPQRADWKTCVPKPPPGGKLTTQELEAQLCQGFKAVFEPYDPAA